MSQYLTIAEAQDRLLDLPNQLSQEPVIITQDGKPVMVTFSYEQIESLLETLEILNDSDMAPLLDQAIQEDQNNKTISWEEAQTQLGWS
jgi:PHD/YefM family antitoxin component YafN of YafNO toxin-antitoxin module